MADTKKQRMLELGELLNRARRAYEQEDTEIMSNYEYDRLYDELLLSLIHISPCTMMLASVFGKLERYYCEDREKRNQ